MSRSSSTTICLIRVENLRGGLRSLARELDSCVGHEETRTPRFRATHLEHPAVDPQLPRRDVLSRLRIWLCGLALHTFALPGLP